MTPEIKQRIQQIRQGQVPKGYRKTKIGMLPLDWLLKPINHWITLKERPIQLIDDEEYQLVTIRRGYGGVDSRGYFYGKDILVKTYFLIHENDFIISKRQIAHGACGVAEKGVDNAVVSNEYDVFIKNDCTNINMFNLMMQLPRFKRLFYLMSDGVHIEKLRFKTEDWMNQNLALPPLPEQTAIAEILTTQDRIIELKEQLLAEKKRQKKYLMQQLLTGKKRLKGFGKGKGYKITELGEIPKDWEVKQLGEVCSFKSGNGFPVIYQGSKNGKYPFIKVSDMSNNIGKFITHANNYITDEIADILNVNIIPKNSIVFAKIGAAVFLERKKILYSDSCIDNNMMGAIVINDICDLQYLYNWFMNFKISSLSNTSALPSISASDLKNITIPLPTLPEQTAIAEILSTADREIELLQQSIEAEKLKKKSLMQLLLTGIVRVTV